jgi:Tol biopolymer transport system component
MKRVPDQVLVRVTPDPLSADEALAWVADDGAGGTCVFVGTVRDHSKAGDVTGLRYEAWDELADRRLHEIAGELFEKWPLRKVASLSPGLANLVMKCLHKDPRKRYRSARDLLADLREFQQDPAGHQEISVVRSGEDLGDLVLAEEIQADVEGTVFSATQPSTGKTLWARVFSSAISGDAAERKRVLARVKRLAEAHRPGLPLIVGSGEARGVPYVVLEPVRGEPVGKLPPREAACAVADLGRALGALHARGVLHGRVETALARRDVERTTFADFGWRAADSAGEETFEESRRAEVRALGAVLHEVLTGAPPGERAFDPRREEPRTPADLAAICRKALHPAEGYRTAGEMVEDLERFLASRPLAHALPATAAYAMKLFLARHRLALLGGGVALLAVFLAALAGLSWRAPRASSAIAVSPPRMISAFKGSSWAASFSPDGRRIAFVNSSSGVAQLWVKDVDGGQPAQLTHGDLPAERPRWSPGGEVIVFARNEKGTKSIWSIPAPPVTDSPRKIIDPGSNPCWSWDGKRLAFERPNEIWTADARGGDHVKVLSLNINLLLANSFPVPSPDGSSILFFQPEDGPKGRYFSVPVRGEPARPLTQEVTFGGAPTWMPPRGDAIVFPSDRSGTTTLWSIPATGGSPAPVTSGSGEDGDPEISRDGRRLLYTNTRVTNILRVTDLKTGDSRELWRLRARLVGPRFSPDGARIAYFADVGGTSRIHVIESDGKSPPRQISPGNEGADIFPRWSPDGASIYYYQVRPSKSFRRIPSEGGESVEIVRGWTWETYSHAALDPSERWLAYAQVRNRILVATWIRDLQTGAERKLDTLIEDLRWSRDGQALVGTHRKQERMTAAISPVEGPILLHYFDGRASRRLAEGFFPQWSGDGTRVYFLRNLPKEDEFELRSVSLETEEEKLHTKLRPMWVIAPFVDISPRDEVVWVEREEGNRELWLMDLDR